MKTKTKADWVIEANKKHEHRYDYSKAVYVNNKTKLCIQCPAHGEFWQEPNAHLKGQKCPKCAVVGGKLNTKEFIRKSKLVHGDTYDYSHTAYVSSKQKVVIVCSVHGEFKQAPTDHLTGKGCLKCGLEATRKSKIIDWCEVARRINDVHGDIYDYSLVNYERMCAQVSIICKVHGPFSKTLDKHINNKEGCPKCSPHGNGGFNGDKPGVLYYLKVDVEGMAPLYKIGITNNTVQERYGARDLSKITVLSEVRYLVGANARTEEQEIIKKYKEFKYIGENVLHSGGNTELFTKDVLGLDKECYE